MKQDEKEVRRQRRKEKTKRVTYESDPKTLCDCLLTYFLDNSLTLVSLRWRSLITQLLSGPI